MWGIIYKIQVWILRMFFPNILDEVLEDIEIAESRVFMLHDYYGEDHSYTEFLD